MIDVRHDCHVHTAFSAGRDSVSVMVGAAEQAGLTEMTFADRVGPDTGWLSSYLAAIHRAQQRTDVTLNRGAEVEAIGVDGWLAFPSDLGGLEVISVGVSRLPLPAGLVGPEAVRSLIASGTVRPLDVIEQLVRVTTLAVARVSRYAPTRVARPLEFLRRSGISDATIPDSVITTLAESCCAHGTVVELSERYQSPSARLVSALLGHGVRILPASDAMSAGEVGRWEYVSEITDDLKEYAKPISRA